KIAINVGVGEAIKQPKTLDVVVEEIATITGQAPVRKKAKKSIANYGLRQGQEIGVAVTLRGAKMWEVLDRVISVAVPRIRDLRCLSTRAFDGRVNYCGGSKERVHSRCGRCVRSRAFLRRFGLCRICFRQLSLEGMIPGVRKASW